MLIQMTVRGIALDPITNMPIIILKASAPNQKPDTPGQAATIIRVYNGAEERIPQTIAFLESVFDVVAEPVADPTMTTDVLVITGTQTKDIKAPSGP